MAYKEGVNSDFFALTPSQPATQAALLTVCGSQKAFHKQIPVSSYVAMPTNGPAWTFATQALKLTRSHLDQGRSRARPLQRTPSNSPWNAPKMTIEAFAPFQRFAADLLKYLPADQPDGSHDLSHIHRVWVNAQRIQRIEGGDLEVLLAATVLHDCVAVEKNSPLRGQASTLSAQRAASILADMGWPLPRIEQVAHAVNTHSYSAGIEPLTLEARILQDSDRLDAIGAVGIARCFYVSGRMGSALYDFENPTAWGREYQDKAYTVEHFHTKLLKLASGFKTAEGARLAAERHARLEVFLADFMDEIGAGGAGASG